MELRWRVRPSDPDGSAVLAGRLGVMRATAQCLLNRGLRSPEEARDFLDPRLAGLHDPFLLPDMERAVARVVRAIRAGERVAIWGDYDVDGVSATALLLRFLRLAGADVHAYLPHRRRDGYGMNEAGLRRLAEAGTGLVVTVDNGITACEEIETARGLGLDVVVTDHHEPGARRPEAVAVVSAKGAGPGTYPFDGLCGVGVAFKLAWAVAQRLSVARRAEGRLRAFLLDAMAFVAVGTIADMGALVGENRILVTWGLKALAASPHPGVRALLAVSGVEGPIDAEAVGYRIAPRLNAAGRMGDPGLALQVLTTDDESEALEAAEAVDRENRRRQDVERAMLAEARPLAARRVVADRMTVPVLASDTWHPGVIGIVAGRLAEDLGRPVCLVALEGEEGTGSARSVPGILLHELLGRCGDHLLAFGGHAQAAGFRIRRQEIPAFEEALGRAVSDVEAPGRVGGEAVADLDLDLAEVQRGLVLELDRLGPFGQANPPPLFAGHGLRIAGEVRRIGARGEHLSFLVRQGGRTLRAVAFGSGRAADTLGAACDLLYRPVINRFRGRETVELSVRALRPAGG